MTDYLKPFLVYEKGDNVWTNVSPNEQSTFPVAHYSSYFILTEEGDFYGKYSKDIYVIVHYNSSQLNNWEVFVKEEKEDCSKNEAYFSFNHPKDFHDQLFEACKKVEKAIEKRKDEKNKANSLTIRELYMGLAITNPELTAKGVDSMTEFIDEVYTQIYKNQ